MYFLDFLNYRGLKAPSPKQVTFWASGKFEIESTVKLVTLSDAPRGLTGLDQIICKNRQNLDKFLTSNYKNDICMGQATECCNKNSRQILTF